MQKNLIDLIHKDTITAGLAAESAEQAIRTLAGMLRKQGAVEAGFAEDVLAREEKFPTGLPTQPFAVAIPHADPDHILSSAIAVATLEQPVAFGRMGGSASATVDARVVFLLAIKETEAQVVLIQQLMQLLQNSALLDNLIEAGDSEQVMDILRRGAV